ncbi:coiled-coil alpha-helical rod protein 1 isoform X4 [Rhinoraja longicauda]
MMEERPGPGRGLEPPSAFGGKIGAESLIPPSHFRGRSCGAPPVDTNPWAALSKATKEILELRQENGRLRRMQDPSNRRCSGIEEETACIQPRYLEQERVPETLRGAGEPEGRPLANTTVSRQAAAIAEKDALLACLGRQLSELRAALRRLERERPEGPLPAGIERPRQRQWDCRPAEETEPEKGGQRDGASREREDRSRETRSQTVAPDVEGSVDEGEETLRQRVAEVEVDREALRRRAGEVEMDRESLRQQVAALEGDGEALRRRSAEAEADRGALSQRAAALQEELRTSQEKGRREALCSRERLEDLGRERDALRGEMSEARCKLDSQSSLIQQLRTYIGRLVPDEKQMEEARQEKEQLNSRVQHLEKERETLRATAELLTVRLSSLTDILSIQEGHRGDKPRPDVGSGDQGKKAPLVTRWREKVFALMVQLKSQEISHTNDLNHIHVKMADVEEGLVVKGRELAVLLHSFNDRTAEMDLERVKNQSLGDNLAVTQKTVVRLQEKADQADSAVRQLQELMRSFYQTFLEQEAGLKKALCQLVNLSQRVTFANKRIDTIHGLWARKEALARLQLQEKSRETGPDVGRRTYGELEKELELLNGERDQLAAELKRNSQLIDRKVTEARLTFEAEVKDCLAVSGRLQEALEEKVQVQQRLAQQLTEAQREAEEAQEMAESLRQELCRQQGKHQAALQEKMAAAESLMAEQLSEMEKHLNEARREHAKAVVELRQADRQAARDKERLESSGKLQEERYKRERQRLGEQLQQLQRDKTLLVATLRQEGLLDQFKRNRAAAVHTSAALSGQPELPRPQPPPQALRPRARDSSKDSLAEVLEELQALSAAVMADQEEREAADEEERTD